MPELDTKKLKCLYLSSQHINIFHTIPVREYLERIVLEENDQFDFSSEDDPRLNGHKIKVLLDKDIHPAMIYVHIDEELAAQYSYGGEIHKKPNIQK